MRVDRLSTYAAFEAPPLRATPELYLKTATPDEETKALDTPRTREGEPVKTYNKAGRPRGDLVAIHLPDRIREKITPPPDGGSDGDYYDVRRIAPRDTAELSMALYVEGVLSWDEHSMLAFQPELHPDYEATIGALTGKAAEPDRPRDLVKVWEEKLSYELRHADQSLLSKKNLAIAQKISSVLRMIDQPVDLVA